VQKENGEKEMAAPLRSFAGVRQTPYLSGFYLHQLSYWQQPF
jgi:hypothetical protein